MNEHGGSSFLWQNLFWFFGHPEVYIMALPGFGIVMEIMPVFTRKPLFAYKVAAAGMLGVALLSFFVWQHHLFQSGINPDMRPLFMLTTELISIPTGFLFLVTLGTLWKAKIRFDTPMLFCLGMLFNFLIGGVTGVFLSDVPVNVTVHGSFFVLAHFHYTIMGGLIFALFGGFYYWFPKITGKTMNRKLSKWHFWTFFIFFNCTFFPLFLVGLLGQPRRVFEYASNLQTLNDISSISAYFLGASFIFFIINFVWSVYLTPHEAPPNPWNSLGLEWQTPTPVPWFNFEHIPVVTNDPYHYGEPDAAPVADLGMAMSAVAPEGSVEPRGARHRSGRRRRSTTPDPVRSRATWHRTRSTTRNSRASCSSRRRRRRSPSSCGPRKGRCGRAAGSSSASGPSPSPPWPSRTSTCARPTTRTSGAPRGSRRPRRPAPPSSPSPWPAALLVQFGERRFRENETLDWQVAGWTAVLGGLLVIGLQIWQLTAAAVLPGVERLRLLLHRLGGDEHRPGAVRDLLDRDHPGQGDPAPPSHRPGRRCPELDPARGAPVPGQPQRLHLLLGLHRRSCRHVVLGTVLCHLSLKR